MLVKGQTARLYVITIVITGTLNGDQLWTGIRIDSLVLELNSCSALRSRAYEVAVRRVIPWLFAVPAERFRASPCLAVNNSVIIVLQVLSNVRHIIQRQLRSPSHFRKVHAENHLSTHPPVLIIYCYYDMMSDGKHRDQKTYDEPAIGTHFLALQESCFVILAVVAVRPACFVSEAIVLPAPDIAAVYYGRFRVV